MTSDQLTSALAVRVMGWSVTPDRFITGGRSWLPKWRFQPFADIRDAFHLLDAAAARYILEATPEGPFIARVWIGASTGTAFGRSRAATITAAIANALGLDVPGGLTEAERQ